MEPRVNRTNVASASRLIDIGKQFQRSGKPEQAEASYRAALEQMPENVEAMLLLSVATGQTGKGDESLELGMRAARAAPGNGTVQFYVGNLLLARRQFAEAAAAYERMTAVQPQAVEGWVHLGIARAEQGDLEDAEVAMRKGVEINRRSAFAHSQLGALLVRRGEFAGAAEHCREALRLEPGQVGTHARLGNALGKIGRFEESKEAYREGLKVFPCDSTLAAGYFMSLHQEGAEAAAQRAELAAWAKRCGGVSIKHFANDRDPERRLRIGYLSPDFRQHAIRFFLEPIIERRDRERVEVTCYSAVGRVDEFTQRFKGMADRWRDIRGVPTEEVVRSMQHDQIDILVDLALHSGDNRLDVMARKPAPVQVAYLGYPGSTGLGSIDYAMFDEILATGDAAERLCVERVWKLPASYFCYRPPAEAPELTELPLKKKGYLTFASFNNFGKISTAALRAWGQVLTALPGSRLLFKAVAFQDRAACEHVAGELERAGVERERLEFRGPGPLPTYLEQMQEADIALDTFPCNGGTTTCHALWMGLPVVSLTGRLPAGRLGLSVLTHVGLAELACGTVGAFVDCAVGLATDVERLVGLRKGMRSRMAGSPLMDEVGRTRDLEGAMRAMWREWCARDPRAEEAGGSSKVRW